jgi:HEAT repeats
MRKNRQITLVISLVLLAILMLICFPRSGAPKYKGRSLDSWLKQLDDNNDERGISWSAWQPKRSPSQEQAAEAIRQLGTNSIPFLLQHMTRHDSSLLKAKVFDFLRQKQSWIKIPLSTNNYPRQAALAFDVLGPVAKPAVPQLSDILTNSQLSKEATIALAAIGPEGWTVLPDTILSTNAPANTWVKSCAVWGLAGHHVVQPDIVHFLITEVTNQPPRCGAIVAWALGELGTNQDEAIPVLIAGLQSPDIGMRWGACTGLGKFGTNAAIAVPALLQSLQDTNVAVKGHAESALKLIDPVAAERAGVK